MKYNLMRLGLLFSMPLAALIIVAFGSLSGCGDEPNRVPKPVSGPIPPVYMFDKCGSQTIVESYYIPQHSNNEKNVTTGYNDYNIDVVEVKGHRYLVVRGYNTSAICPAVEDKPEKEEKR